MSDKNLSWIEHKCLEYGLKMTKQRRLIAKVLSEAKDHPDVEALYRRISQHDRHVSIATVYRTIRLFEENGIILRHDFGDGRSRLELVIHGHHDHLINLDTGEVIEFSSDKITALQNQIAQKYDMVLEGSRLELYARPKKSNK